MLFVDYDGIKEWVRRNAVTIDSLSGSELEESHSFGYTTFTPLHMAIIANRRDLVELLIAKGARTDRLKDMLARYHWKFKDIFDLCFRSGNERPGFDLMSRAIREHDIPALTWMLDNGGDPNAFESPGFKYKAELGFTLLGVALHHNYRDAFELLVRRGGVITPRIVDRALVSTDDAESLVRLLVASRVGICELNPDAQGQTLLWKVCSGLYRGDARVASVNLLIENGSAVNVADADSGTTPLMFAATRGEKKLISLLLKAGADPHARDSAGRSALDFASLQNQNAVKALRDAVGYPD